MALRANQNKSGCYKNKPSAGSKVEETKSAREVALEEELDLWKSRYVELESYYKNLEASVEIARKNSPGLSFPTPNAKATSVHDDVSVPDSAVDDNAKATSVCDDIDEADVAADDNAKATSVHDDVGVPDAAADDNAKATSVCDDINEADAAADDNAKATSVHDDVGVPDAVADDNAKATSVCDDIDQADAAAYDNAKKKGDGLDEAKANQKDTEPEVTVVKKTRKKRMSKRQRELPTSTRRRSKRHIQEVVSATDNGEVVKETQLPDSHEDVFQPRASKRMKKETLLSNWPPIIGNYLKEIHIARWEEVVELWVQLMWHFGPKHADWAIFSPYYFNLPTPNDHGDWIFKDITKGVVTFYDTLIDKKPWDKDDHPWWIKFWQLMSKKLRKGMSKHGVFKQKKIHPGYTITFTSPLNVPKQSSVYDDCGVWIQAWGNPVWTSVSDVLLPDPVLKHDVPCLLLSALNLGKAECSNCIFLAEKMKALKTKIKTLEATLEMERQPEKGRWSALNLRFTGKMECFEFIEKKNGSGFEIYRENGVL
ncbi:hypothetical protein Tco_0067084 [Tanacetum coccineum]